jgi:peroxiredoxin
MIPAERSLVKQMTGRPFVLVGVNLDHSPGDLRQFAAQQQLPWRNWFDGDHAITQRWAVEGLPTVFLIDANGVIRYIGRDSAVIDATAERLVKEAEKGKQSS